MMPMVWKYYTAKQLWAGLALPEIALSGGVTLSASGSAKEMILSFGKNSGALRMTPEGFFLEPPAVRDEKAKRAFNRHLDRAKIFSVSGGWVVRTYGDDGIPTANYPVRGSTWVPVSGLAPWWVQDAREWRDLIAAIVIRRAGDDAGANDKCRMLLEDPENKELWIRYADFLDAYVCEDPFLARIDALTDNYLEAVDDG